MSQQLILVTDAAAEPITSAQAKTFMRVSTFSEDTLLDSIIKAARRQCERYMRRALINQTWEYHMDYFPVERKESAGTWWDGVREGSISSLYATKNIIELPLCPLVSVSSFITYDTGNVASTFSASNYLVDTKSYPGRIALNFGQVWPVNLREADAIKITFVAGYGSAATSVPQDIIHAIYLTVAHYFENRGQSEWGDNEIPPLARIILDSYRVPSL